MKIKVCGLKYPDNISELVKYNPDYIGFIFYKLSKRYVGEEFVMPEIPISIQKVGVFVNPSMDELKNKIKTYKLDVVQLHGNESADFCKLLKSHIKVIKVFSIREGFNFSILKKYKDNVDYFLFDTFSQYYGGSGISFNKKELLAQHIEKPFFISGGIDIEEAILLRNNKNIYGLDINSRFEKFEGFKNINKIKKLLNEIHN